MLITESSREIWFALVVKSAKTRSGGLVDELQSTGALVTEFVFTYHDLQWVSQGLSLLLKKRFELIPLWED